MFISGKVVLEGGGTLLEPVAIERICGDHDRRACLVDFSALRRLKIDPPDVAAPDFRVR